MNFSEGFKTYKWKLNNFELIGTETNFPVNVTGANDCTRAITR